MKKNLFTCFLVPIAIGMLCLFGSTFSAQSKVAESPGAGLLHRFAGPSVSPHSRDTHRGGAILSDTFLYHNGGMDSEDIGNKETSASLSGAPRSDVSGLASCVLHLESSDSLVDQYLDPGAGEEIPILQPAPVTVFPSPTSGVKVSQVTRFHIELPNTTAPDTLRLTYWDHFLKEHREVTPGTSIDLIANRGSFFEGNAGYKVYRWEMEGMEATRVFSIRMGSHHLIRYWNIPPGAQVKVRMELNSGVTYFWGPSSRFFKAQQEVDRLASEQSWQQSPLMVTNNPERMLSDSLISHYHQKSLSLPQELYLPMFFVVGGKSDRELLETYLSKPLEDYPLIRELAPLTEGMSETSKNLLVQRAYGETLRQLVSKLKLGRSWLKEEPFSTGFEAMLRELPIPTADQELDPVFLSAIYELVLLKGSIDRVPITRMLENYPATVSDRVLGLYLLDNFKRLEEHQNQYLADVLREVELPWVQELILDLKSRSLSGNTLMAPPLSDMEGKPFDLARLEGKAMVVSFWITGCRFCMRYYQNTLKEVYERWSDRDEVVFVSVNADPNSQKWKESVATELYSHPKMIQLHQDAGSGILADFRISSFPQKLLITPDRKIFLLTLTQYSPDQLSGKIAQLLAQPEISQETKNTGF